MPVAVLSAAESEKPVVPPGELPLADLADELCSLAARISAAECRWLLLLAEFDTREGWAQWSCSSCAHWLSWRCGLSPGTARERIRVAHRLADLPLVQERYGRGGLSWSKVRAITRVATRDTEEELVAIADACTASQLDRVVAGFRTARSADLDVAEVAHARRFLSWQWDEDGSLVFRGRLAPEAGAAFLAAVEETVRRTDAVDRVQLGGMADEEAAAAAQQPDAVGRGARAADALIDMAEATLSSPAAGPRAAYTQVVLHVDAASLSGERVVEECALEAGPAIPPETARRLACDSSVVVMRSRGNGSVDVGRRTRTIPPALRRALERRDKGCRFPGCTRRRGLDAHHVEHWAHGGATDRDNLLLLCGFHHRRAHEGGFVIRVRDGGFEFVRPDGVVLEPAPRPELARVRDLSLQPDAGTITARTPVPPHWHGERLDLPWVVGGLCDAERRARQRRRAP